MKWADDDGGRPEWKDPPQWTEADRVLEKVEGVIARGSAALETEEYGVI